ncbi:MAG: putative membrane protein [Planctomycetota bacterium]|jgi:uncharacterized membrane protein
MELFELGDRWLHFGAGVLWIGILYFFNWVNSAFAPTMDGETKKKVIPELMPRALYWFRWGAAFTWITGVLLLFLVYYHGYDGANLFDGQHAAPTPADWGPAFAGLFVGFLVYDILFKAMAKLHTVAVVIWAGITVGYAYYLSSQLGFSDRAAYIHVAGLFGTAMAANVWMRIWPAQNRIITAIKNGEAPIPGDVGMAGLRSKHNTYMSVPLLLLMVGVGQPMMFNYDLLTTIGVVLVIGFVVTYGLYSQAKKVPGF